MDTANQYRILIVDDEADILEFLTFNLKQKGFVVFATDNGLDAIEIVKHDRPHLVIMDVMMPDMDGIEAVRRIRNLPDTDHIIIVFLSARAEDYTQIAGLDAGGDIFLTKPIKPRLLVSKIIALLKRFEPEDKNILLVAGNIMIDKEKHKVYFDERAIDLPRKEFDLLSLLAAKPGKVFLRNEIMHKVWGDDVIVGDRTLDVHIRRIRQKLGDALIQTVKGVGYKLAVE